MLSFCLPDNRQGSYMIIPLPSCRTNKNHNCHKDCVVHAVLFNPVLWAGVQTRGMLSSPSPYLELVPGVYLHGFSAGDLNTLYIVSL